jgi:hypothetical protein
MSEDNKLVSKTVERALTFSLLEMTPSGMRFLKIVNVFKGIAQALEGESMREFKNKTEWLFVEDFNDFLETVKVKLEINDNGDVCVKLQPKKLNSNDAD